MYQDLRMQDKPRVSLRCAAKISLNVLIKTHFGLIVLLTLFGITVTPALAKYNVTIITTSYSNSVAKDMCKSQGFDGLAVATTPAKQEYLLNITEPYRANGKRIWIGLRHYKSPDTFVWDNGFAYVSEHRVLDGASLSERFGKPCLRIGQGGLYNLRYCQNTCFPACEKYNAVSKEFKVVATDRSPDNGGAPAAILWSGTTRSLVDCKNLCVRDEACSYTAYNHDSFYCYIIAGNFDPVTDGIPAAGVTIYSTFP